MRGRTIALNKTQESDRRWVRENRDKINKWHRRWREKNPERVRIYEQARRAREYASEGTFTLREWKLLKVIYGYRCPVCGESEPEIKLTVDHIIPLIKHGSNFIENIQPLCLKCNIRKGAEVWKVLPNGQKIFFDLQTINNGNTMRAKRMETSQQVLRDWKAIMTTWPSRGIPGSPDTSLDASQEGRKAPWVREGGAGR